MSLDLYLGLKGVPITNPPVWYETLRMGAGNGVEDAMLQILKDSRIVDPYYDQDFDGRVEMEREGVVIHGYMDAIRMDNGQPIEIKSINNKNAWDIRKYETGEPRESYIGQLSIYQDFLGKDTGHLFVSSVDGLSRFWFDNKRVSDTGDYQCGMTCVNIANEYKRWAKIKAMVDNNEKPDIFEYRYKYPLESIDWANLSADKISKARTGKAVIGDWQVLYSPWKDLIVKLQGTELGYSLEELKYINKVTEGYTNWKKK